jgi:hypothetical protein
VAGFEQISMHSYGMYGKIPTSKSIVAKEITFYRDKNYFFLYSLVSASKDV